MRVHRQRSSEDEVGQGNGERRERGCQMAMTLWTNTTTGRLLDQVELARFRRRARRVYEVNTHIFEDEVDALAALGVVPLVQFEPFAAA